MEPASNHGLWLSHTLGTSIESNHDSRLGAAGPGVNIVLPAAPLYVCTILLPFQQSINKGFAYIHNNYNEMKHDVG